MSKLSKRDSLLLIVIALAVVVGGLYWFYVRPARADLDTASKQAQEAQANVDQLDQQLAALTSKATKPSKVPLADELLLAKAYPYSEDVPVTILQVEELARQTNVSLGEMTPADGTDYAGVTGTPFTITVTGKFFDVQDFLYRLHNRVRVGATGRLLVKGRLFAVTKADLSPGNKDAATTASSDETISANITVVAFSRTPGGGLQADPAQQSTNSGGTPS